MLAFCVRWWARVCTQNLKFDPLVIYPFPPSLSLLCSSPIPRVLGLGFRVHCGACELSSLASVIWLSLSFFPGGLDSSSKQKKRKEKTNASAAVKEVVVWIVDIRTVATMAGGDTDMRSWADLLHNSSQLLHSYSPSAPLPPIQVLFKKIKSFQDRIARIAKIVWDKSVFCSFLLSSVPPSLYLFIVGFLFFLQFSGLPLF